MHVPRRGAQDRGARCRRLRRPRGRARRDRAGRPLRQGRRKRHVGRTGPHMPAPGRRAPGTDSNQDWLSRSQLLGPGRASGAKRTSCSAQYPPSSRTGTSLRPAGFPGQCGFQVLPPGKSVDGYPERKSTRRLRCERARSSPLVHRGEAGPAGSGGRSRPWPRVGDEHRARRLLVGSWRPAPRGPLGSGGPTGPAHRLGT